MDLDHGFTDSPLEGYDPHAQYKEVMGRLQALNKDPLKIASFKVAKRTTPTEPKHLCLWCRRSANTAERVIWPAPDGIKRFCSIKCLKNVY